MSWPSCAHRLAVPLSAPSLRYFISVLKSPAVIRMRDARCILQLCCVLLSWTVKLPACSRTRWPRGIRLQAYWAVCLTNVMCQRYSWTHRALQTAPLHQVSRAPGPSVVGSACHGSDHTGRSCRSARPEPDQNSSCSIAEASQQLGGSAASEVYRPKIPAPL